MKRNLLILIAGKLLVLSGALLKLQTHHEFSRILMLSGVAMGIYAGVAIVIQINKKLTKA